MTNDNRKTGGWLLMIADAQLLPERRLTDLIDEGDQLSKIIGKSRLTAKRNAQAL
jgi:hypothetical protein